MNALSQFSVVNECLQFGLTGPDAPDHKDRVGVISQEHLEGRDC